MKFMDEFMEEVISYPIISQMFLFEQNLIKKYTVKWWLKYIMNVESCSIG